MAENDEDGPSLELPSFFRRKRVQKAEPPPPERDEAPEPVAAPEPAAEPEPVPQPASPPEPVAEPLAAPEPEPEPPTAPLEPVAATTRTDVPPVPAPQPVAEPTPEPTRPVQVEEPAPAPAPAPRRKRREPRERTLPAISGSAASIITGLLVGAIMVGLTWASLRLCEVLQGTSSCGDPGFLLLSAIMVLMIVLGGLLLRAWGIPDPRSTSFLAVGLTAVIALLFLIDVIFAWWMIIAIPVTSAATFVLSHWVTTTFIEPTDR